MIILFILVDREAFNCLRSPMGVNGESMGRKWPKETHVLELIIGVPWLLVAQLENRYL